jgi:hypothetical protein
MRSAVQWSKLLPNFIANFLPKIVQILIIFDEIESQDIRDIDLRFADLSQVLQSRLMILICSTHEYKVVRMENVNIVIL